jgi:hypothetical protein
MKVSITSEEQAATNCWFGLMKLSNCRLIYKHLSTVRSMADKCLLG